MLRVGSLFSGIGGFDEGFIRAGMDVSWQCESDPQCLSVLRYLYPNTKTFEDVKHVTKPIEPVDLLCGGFPCQDLSVAGRREGLAGERSGLFSEFMRILTECSPSPRWVVIENVPGLLSSNKGRDMETVLGALEERGYGWAYRCLDSQFFGVPQRRRRVFIVGHLGDWRSAAKILFERESVRGDSAPSRKKRPGITQAITGRLGGGGPDDNRAQAGHLISMGFHSRQDPIHENEISLPLEYKQGQCVAFDTTQITSAENGCNPQPGDPCHPFASGAHASAIAIQDANRYEKRMGGLGVKREGDPMFTLDQGSQHAVALTSKGNGECWESDVHTSLSAEGGGQAGQGYPAVRHGMQVRRLTPRECERLQGFPDDWTRWGMTKEGEVKEITDGPRYKMLGNAVTVQVAEWIGRRIKDFESGEL